MKEKSKPVYAVFTAVIIATLSLGAVMHFTHNQCDNKSNIEYYEYY